MADTVLYECAEHVATLRYNRAEARNAINRHLRTDLNAAWARFRDDDDAWVGIITGQGSAFCAGADLKDPGGAVGGLEHSFWEIPSAQSLEGGMELWKPVIAAVNGPAIGFGLTMVSACDFVIASDRASFAFPEVQLGVPTVQGAVRMPRLIGWQNAMELLLIGDSVAAHRAKEMGLVWRVVPHDELMTEAHALARRLLKAAPLAQRATKEIARRGLDNDLLSAVRFGETMRRVAAQTADAAALVSTTLKGERPAWQGR